MTNYTIFLQEFIASYDGEPIVFVATGAGMSLAELTIIPGSSKVVEEILIPYGDKAFKKIVPEIWHKYPRVSPEITRVYCLDAKVRFPQSSIVVVNGALITNRYRKGAHHAYFIVNDELYHITLPKETEEQWNEWNNIANGSISNYGIQLVRSTHDQIVAKCVLTVIEGDNSPFDEGKGGVKMEKVTDYVV